MIRAEHTSLVYSDHGREIFACRDVTLEIAAGEFVGILGPSGSGKSSLLYLLSGLKTPTTGEITYGGKRLSALGDEGRSRLRLKEFGFVFQQAFLLGYLNVLENVLIAYEGVAPRDEAVDLLEKLGMGGKLERKPHELSGGERQRACVARALLGSPRVIFADEPTASLDHANGAAVVELLNQHRGDGSLVMVTHDATMLDKADQVIRLVDGAVWDEA